MPGAMLDAFMAAFENSLGAKVTTSLLWSQMMSPSMVPQGGEDLVCPVSLCMLHLTTLTGHGIPEIRAA